MSIRKFRPEAVSAELLREVVSIAGRSPSYKNTQPWEVVIVSGRKKDDLSEHLIGLLESGATPSPDLPEPASWPPEINARIEALIRQRKEAFGIDLNSPDVRKRSKIANFRFYGAPHGIFLFQDGSLNEWSILDIGMFCQSLMLAAHAMGLGTVPQAFLTDYAGEVKKLLGIPETKRLVLGLSIGYPDMTSTANSLRTERVDSGDILRLIE